MAAEDYAEKTESMRCFWLRGTVLAALYLIAWLVLWYSTNTFNQATGMDLWIPCAGLSVALLLSSGSRALPLLLLAALVTGWSGNFHEYRLSTLVSNVAPLPGYLLATFVLLHYRRGERRTGVWRFDDPRQAAVFLSAAALGALLAALANTVLAQQANLPLQALAWRIGHQWASHFIGIITLAPPLLLFLMPPAYRWMTGEPQRLTGRVLATQPPLIRLGFLQMILSALLLSALFWASHPQWLGQSNPFATLILLPLLTWIAAVHGARGAATTMWLYQIGISALAANGGRPELTVLYQIAMVAIATSGLFTGAVSQARLATIARFRQLAEVASDLLWEFDEQGRLTDLRGPLFQKTKIRGANSPLGHHWQDYVLDTESGNELTMLRTALRKHQQFQQVILRLRLPNRPEPVWTRNSGLPLFDDSGEFRGYRGTTTLSNDQQAQPERRHTAKLLQDNDIEAEVEARVAARTRTLAEASLRNWQLANFDNLTGLPNRNLFFEHLRKSLQQAHRHRRALALLMVDLDGFKAVNDTFGHEAGDELLRQIAARLRHCIRATDIAARLGGDEFTIVLTDLEQTDAVTTVACKLVAALAEPILMGDRTASVTASVGIALYHPERPATLETGMALLRQADTAMYEAKRAGKNAWRFAEE